MSKPTVSPEFPSSLVDEINSLAGGPYIGASYESIMRYNSYEEGSNFKMDESDILLTQVYAGLAVYAKDTLDYLKNTKADETPAMMQVFQLVSREEKPRFRDASFPYDSPYFPYQNALAVFPAGLAEKASRADFSIEGLDNIDIRHEWTVKTGKRIFLYFLREFQKKIKAPVCKFYNNQKEDTRGYVKDVAQLLFIHAGLSEHSFWIPFIGFIAVLLVKKGMDLFCKGELV